MDTAINDLLLEAREQKVKVKLSTENELIVRGNLNAPVMAKLKDNKEKVIELLRERPNGIANIVDRLRKGQQLLIKQNKELWDKEGAPVGSKKDVERFNDNMATWDTLDETLRSYGEYDGGCPVGPKGCDPASPVACRTCGK